MSKVKEAFDSVFDLILSEMEQQRDIHNGAFGKPNASKVVLQVERNNKQLKSWLEVLQRVHNEMETSGLFDTRSENVISTATFEIAPKSVKDFDPTGKRPRSFTIFGTKYRCTSWKDLTVEVANALYDKAPEIISNLNDNPKLNRIFTKTDIGYHSPRQIKGGLWFETNRNAKHFKDIWETILEICGYSVNDIEIEINNKELITV
jgi:hypothetical protein